MSGDFEEGPEASWKEVKWIFEQAIELEPDARARLLDEECAGDDGLRHEVESLLVAHDDSSADNFFGVEDDPGQIGPYKLAPANFLPHFSR